jgi:hypothetical protein
MILGSITQTQRDNDRATGYWEDKQAQWAEADAWAAKATEKGGIPVVFVDFELSFTWKDPETGGYWTPVGPLMASCNGCLPPVALVGWYALGSAWSGRPDRVVVDFRDLDLSRIQLTNFPGFRDAVTSLPPGGSTNFRSSMVVDFGTHTTGSTTIYLSGSLAKNQYGQYSFSGTIRPIAIDTYNFNRPGLANDIGRYIIPGRDFDVVLIGSIPVSVQGP